MSISATISAGKRSSFRKTEFVIGGVRVNYVDRWRHLSHIITSCNDNRTDILNRRNALWLHK